jgi:predicted MPP superfamily phosphohydrolase
VTVPRFLLFVAFLAAILLAWGYAGATADPRIRHARIALPDWPAGSPPIRILLLSDLHVAGPDMPPSRLTRILDRAAALDPDLLLVAGDFVSDRKSATRTYGFAEAVAPLGRLHPRLGTFAVLGNHDHWRSAPEARRALAVAGVRLLDNEAVRAGPLALGGIDDAFTGHEDVAATVQAMRRLDGAKLLLSHSPDPFPDLPDDISLMLAGHTHCGQVRLPLIGAVSTMSRYGERYACGLVREGHKTLIVSAGLGTSILPLRIGAPPDMWLIEVGAGAVSSRVASPDDSESAATKRPRPGAAR